MIFLPRDKAPTYIVVYFRNAVRFSAAASFLNNLSQICFAEDLWQSTRFCAPFSVCNRQQFVRRRLSRSYKNASGSLMRTRSRTSYGVLHRTPIFGRLEVLLGRVTRASVFIGNFILWRSEQNFAPSSKLLCPTETEADFEP